MSCPILRLAYESKPSACDACAFWSLWSSRPLLESDPLRQRAVDGRLPGA